MWKAQAGHTVQANNGDDDDDWETDADFVVISFVISSLSQRFSS